jgi:hypothetical protein
MFTMADESDLVVVSNESKTDSNPRKRQETLVIFYKINQVLHVFKYNASACLSQTTYIEGNT